MESLLHINWETEQQWATFCKSVGYRCKVCVCVNDVTVTMISNFSQIRYTVCVSYYFVFSKQFVILNGCMFIPVLYWQSSRRTIESLMVLYSSWTIVSLRESTSCSLNGGRTRALVLTRVRSLKIVFVKSSEIPHVKLLGSSNSLNSCSVSREESWSRKTSGRSFTWGSIALFFLQGPQSTGILGSLAKVFSWFSWHVISHLGSSLGGTPVGIWILRRLTSVEDFLVFALSISF